MKFHTIKSILLANSSGAQGLCYANGSNVTELFPKSILKSLKWVLLGIRL